MKEKLESPHKNDGNRTTIFSELLAADYHGIGSATTIDDLLDEASVILAAASDTTGNAMTIASYNILTNHIIRENLSKELQIAFPDASTILDLVTLENCHT